MCTICVDGWLGGAAPCQGAHGGGTWRNPCGLLAVSCPIILSWHADNISVSYGHVLTSLFIYPLLQTTSCLIVTISHYLIHQLRQWISPSHTTATTSSSSLKGRSSSKLEILIPLPNVVLCLLLLKRLLCTDMNSFNFLHFQAGTSICRRRCHPIGSIPGGRNSPKENTTRHTVVRKYDTTSVYSLVVLGDSPCGLTVSALS